MNRLPRFFLLTLCLQACRAPGGADTGLPDEPGQTWTIGELTSDRPPVPFAGEVEEVTVEWFGERQTVLAERHGELLVYGGDIVVRDDSTPAPPSNQGITSSGAWTDCTVPYEINYSSGTDTSDITDAIAYWEANEDITFVPRTTEADYVEFVQASECSSYVGMIGGPQEIHLDLDTSDGTYCSYGAAVHEIGHALGLRHEHQRTDRDTYIVANSAAFDGSVSWSVNFGTAGTTYGSYDFDSIMEYGSCFFSACSSCGSSSDPDTCFTLYENNSSKDYVPGHGDTLSSGDIASIASIYAGDVYLDADGDGHGDASSSVTACGTAPPVGYVEDGDDCDDADAGVYPGASETCDGVDEDCDGATDEGATAGTAYRDLDGDGYGDASVSDDSCTPPSGYVFDDSDCDDHDGDAHPGGIETCDGTDEDCDGSTDEDALYAATWYADTDGDGYGNRSATTSGCAAPTGYVADATDCDDGAPGVHPGAAEVCDGSGTDEDCDGAADDADPSVAGGLPWYEDDDHDGFGDPSRVSAACEVPTGFVADATDCDDTRGDVNPAASEVCDGDTDEDCDQLVDDDDPSVSAASLSTWFTDADGDGYGDASDAATACSAIDGTVADDADCDDGDASIHPGAQERCDDEDTDEDCDGASDDADDSTAPSSRSFWHEDADGDGFGAVSGPALERCDVPAAADAWVLDATDCDDADALDHPGADERCDGDDNDCDGAAGTGEQDADADTWLPCAGDCDDGDPTAYPGAPELSNGVDADCDDAAVGAIVGCGGCDAGPGDPAALLLAAAALGTVGRQRRRSRSA